MRTRHEKQIDSQILDLSSITVDQGVRCRAAADERVVGAYAEAMRNGSQFPPIQVVTDGTITWVWDGFYRVEAMLRIGIKETPALITQGTRLDAVRLAAGANADHGVSRTSADLNEGISQLVELAESGEVEDSDEAFADITNTWVSTVSSMRQGELDAGGVSTPDDDHSRLMRVARAIGNNEHTAPIGPETARDISAICGTTVIESSGRRFLFGREMPVQREHIVGNERSIADDWYRFRDLVQPMYWMARHDDPEQAIAAIPLMAREEAWDAIAVVTNWMNRATSAWTEQFRDPNRINPSDGSSPEDIAYGFVLHERWSEVDTNEHRHDYDHQLIDNLCHSADRLAAHLRRGENLVASESISQGVESAIESLVANSPLRFQQRLSTELFKIGLVRVVRDEGSYSDDLLDDPEVTNRLKTVLEQLDNETETS